MMGIGKKRASPLAIEQEQFATLIGRGTVIEGTITAQASLRIDGHLKGSVRAADDQSVTVVVSGSGQVEGDLCAPRVVVAGQVCGQIHASDRVELHAGCLVQGDIRYGSIAIEHGAKVLGLLLQTDATPEALDQNVREAIKRVQTTR